MENVNIHTLAMATLEALKLENDKLKQVIVMLNEAVQTNNESILKLAEAVKIINDNVLAVCQRVSRLALPQLPSPTTG